MLDTGRDLDESVIDAISRELGGAGVGDGVCCPAGRATTRSTLVHPACTVRAPGAFRCTVAFQRSCEPTSAPQLESSADVRRAHGSHGSDCVMKFAVTPLSLTAETALPAPLDCDYLRAALGESLRSGAATFDFAVPGASTATSRPRRRCDGGVGCHRRAVPNR